MEDDSLLFSRLTIPAIEAEFAHTAPIYAVSDDSVVSGQSLGNKLLCYLRK